MCLLCWVFGSGFALLVFGDLSRFGVGFLVVGVWLLACESQEPGRVCCWVFAYCLGFGCLVSHDVLFLFVVF